MWLTCIAFVVLHGGTGIWWAATINANVKLLKEQVAANTGLMKDRYTGLQAAKDNAVQDAKVEVIAKELSSHTGDPTLHHQLKYRLDVVERSMDKFHPMGELSNVPK